MQWRLPFLMLLCGCPDYTLKGTIDLTPEGSDTADTPTPDTAVPDDSEDPPEDTGDTHIEETEDEEICDGVDNDGDGEIDEGFEDSDGDGIVDCLETTYTIDIAISVDDIWEGWSDGIPFAAERAGWNVLDEYGLVLDSGPHVIAIHGWDTGRAISGHLSTVSIDGVIQHVTGDGSWRVQANTAPEGWQEIDFDDSGWMTPVACVDTSPWASWTPEIMDDGAVWTWYEPSGNCRDPSAYGSAYYRLRLDLP